MIKIGAILGGLVAGVIGGAVWAGISYGTGYEIGWIAWGIGALVGAGVLMGSSRAGGPANGVLAVIISVLAILGGKYAVVELFLNNLVGDAESLGDEEAARLKNDEYVISHIADKVADEFVAQGRDLQWPPGVDPREMDSEADYPPEVWAEAASRWHAKSESD